MTCEQAHCFVSRSALLALSTLLVAALALPAVAVTISTVPIGNAGNAQDPLTGNLYGGVNYDYRIGTTEVTNAQYAEFLNFKAASDPLGLYSTFMDIAIRGGITRSGVSGSFTYAVKPNMADKPVNHVSWFDAIRFANWLHNGQGTGDTETGAYTILGGTAIPSNSNSITRNPGATWFLPSENEWYKAAYHQPASQGGDADNYWLYPTVSNAIPTVALANSVGDISNPGANVVNYSLGADWNGQEGNVTTVGSAGLLSKSFYGTYDQGGNVWEWNEALISGSFPYPRGLRGNGWDNLGSFFQLQSMTRGGDSPNAELSIYGFRVATVPESGTAVLGMIGCVLMFWWRKMRN